MEAIAQFIPLIIIFGIMYVLLIRLLRYAAVIRSLRKAD